MIRAKDNWMKPDLASRYHARMQRVLSYIDEHLDDDLDVDLLSGVAAFSKYRFHRQFTSLFGINIHRYVQLLRLQRASYRLAFAGDYRLDLCCTTDRIDTNDAGVVAGVISAGRCATLRLIGNPHDLRPAVQFLYGDWLPRSGRELRDHPIFVQRVTLYPDVPEHEAVTDIFLPLAG
jgi:AraC-like DNA-binding protein